MKPLPLGKVDEVLARATLRRVGPYVRANLPIDCVCLTCGKAVAPRFASVQRGHQGCKFCTAKARAARRQTPHEDAERLMRAAGVEPLEPYVNFSHPWKSKCLGCGEVVTPQFQNVKNGHHPCKYCSGNAITAEKATSIYLARGAKPSVPFTRTNTPWEGVCLTCGSSVAPRLDDLKRGQGPCKKCGQDKTSASQRLSEEEAFSRMIASGAQPLEPWADKKIDDPWLSECLTCHNIITPTVHSVSNGAGPCIHCGWQKASSKRTFDGDEQAQILLDFGFRALEPYKGMGESWHTECLKCGSQRQRIMANVKSGIGCYDCSYEARKTPEILAVAEMRKRGWEPLEPYKGSSISWLCKCLKCGYKTPKRLYSLTTTSKTRGCVSCGERTLGSLLYLVHHSQLMAYKIGVGKQRRIDEHRQNGWDLVDVWDLQTPLDAYSIEKEVLMYVREIWQLPQFLGRLEMPQKGETETFSAHSHSNLEVIHLINRLRVKV